MDMQRLAEMAVDFINRENERRRELRELGYEADRTAKYVDYDLCRDNVNEERDNDLGDLLEVLSKWLGRELEDRA